MPSLRRPRAIPAGARIAIAAPAGPVDPEALASGRSALEGLGFETVVTDDILDRSGYLAGSDDRRAKELMGFVEDPEVDAILCARGGYGCHRIIQSLDAETFRKAAKPLIGYSDITTLLLWQRQQAGLLGIHGPMLERSDALTGEAGSALGHMLRGIGPLPRYAGESGKGGRAEGQLIGGSLTICVASLGTPWEIDTRGAILMLEEIAEAPYRIDRLLEQLRAAGKFDQIVGVALGTFTDCADERYPEWTVTGLLDEILGSLEIPLVSGLPFGHNSANLPWPYAGRAALDGSRSELEILESAVMTR